MAQNISNFEHKCDEIFGLHFVKGIYLNR